MLQRADVAEVMLAEGRRGKRGTWIRIAVIVAIIALVIGGAIAAWNLLRGGGSVTYATMPVERGDIAVVLTATGTLEPTQQVAVSSLVTGTVSSVDVDFDQPVSQGQVLARLDLRSFDLRLRRAVAMVDAQSASQDSAKAGVSDAEAALRRLGELAVADIVSAEKLELATTALQRAKAGLAAAQAQLKAAEADLASARDDYDKAIIVSPINGIVLDVNAEVGQAINAASLVSSLFVVASDIRRLDLEADIDEADVAQVKVGDSVTFTVEAIPNQPFAGIVKQVRTGPTVTNGITSYKAIIGVDNGGRQLRPGMTATADISTAHATDVLTVPNAALRFTLEGEAASADEPPRVHVLNGNILTAVDVEVGLSDGQRTEVSSDSLAAGDLVVIGKTGR